MNNTLKRLISGSVYVFIMWFGASHSRFSFHILFITLGIISLYEMWNMRKGKNKIFPLLYIILPFSLIHLVENQDFILYIFILTWTFDTFAYIVGTKLGKHKIMASISPKKSWEGFAGGFLFTLIAAYILMINEIIDNKDQIFLYSTPFILPFTATLGDFISSYYKRKSKIKDSGSLIPGHGGMLDRMDAFLITIPLYYIMYTLTSLLK